LQRRQTYAIRRRGHAKRGEEITHKPSSNVLKSLQKIKKYVGRKVATRAIPASPFYQRYPYGGKLKILTADRQGLFDPDHEFFYNRIAKSANSTVTINLAQLKFRENFELPGAKKRLLQSDILRPSQLTIDQVDSISNVFTFTFVRNPYSRVLSAYLDKVATGKKNAGKDGSIPTFGEFCDLLEDGWLYADLHWAPQMSSLVMPACEFDFIGRVENFEQDFQKVWDRIGGGRQIGNTIHRSQGRTDATNKADDYYDGRSRRIVSSLYAEDFEAFGY
jgi:hypothetical protein